jgi:hypothetical protein
MDRTFVRGYLRCGLLFRSNVRKYLEQCTKEFDDFRFEEIKYALSSEFIIYGYEANVDAVLNKING